MEYRQNAQKEFVRIILNEFADMVAEKLAPHVMQLIEKNQPKTYTRKEVCNLLQVTTQTLGTYVKQGKLTPLSTEKGRGQLFDAAQVDEALGTGRLRKFTRNTYYHGSV